MWFCLIEVNHHFDITVCNTVGMHLSIGHLVRIRHGKHRDDDHREEAPHFTSSTTVQK